MNDPGIISVIIPHLNQPEPLRACLASIARQTGMRRQVEVVVVDNGSSIQPDDICADQTDVTLITEATPGPGPARNAGARIARGGLLAFIDADCTADPGWLAAIEATFDDPACQVIGGDVRVGYVDPKNPTFLEPYEAIYSYRNHLHIAEGYSGTGNLAMRREIFDRVGPFAGIGVAEDHEWGLRAKGLGFITGYVPGMIVFHPARKDFADLALKWDRHISHEYALLTGPLGPVKWAAKALAMAVSPLAEIPNIVTTDRISGGKERVLAFLCLVRVRVYRMKRMALVLLTGEGKDDAHAWNRSGGASKNGHDPATEEKT